LNPEPLAYHGQPPGKINRIADHFAKMATKNKDFGKIYSLQTWISFLGITLFILFDPQTPLPSPDTCELLISAKVSHLTLWLTYMEVMRNTWKPSSNGTSWYSAHLPLIKLGY
jgi:hypothetical protein